MLSTHNNVCHVLSGQEMLAIDVSKSRLQATDCPREEERRKTRSSKGAGTLEIILQMTAQRRA